MKQPARSRETSQRISREDLASAAGFGRMAELGALATAASAMAIGVLNAKEQPPSTANEQHGTIAIPDTETAARHAADTDQSAQSHENTNAPMPSAELVSLPDSAIHENRTALADALLDPSALTSRIAEQIASSVSHVLDIASGGQSTPQTLSRDIVEQARSIAQEVHGAFVAQEPLAVLADLVPQHVGLDTLASSIIQDVDQALTESDVIDLLQGTTTIGPDPDHIVHSIMADLHGLKGLTDVAAVSDVPQLDLKAIPESVLGGLDLGKNPLADLFYDDGGADAPATAVNAVGDAVSDLASELPKIGFVGQPIDLGDELGGLTNGHNALNLL